MRLKKRNKRKNKLVIIFILIIIIFVSFYFWYINIYRYDLLEPIPSDDKRTTTKQSLTFPSKITENYTHIPWGVPKLKNNKYKIKSSSNIILKRYEGYACGYNREKKISDWVSYKVKREFLFKKKILKRKKFKPAPSIMERFSAKLSDYKRSGYDRGHLARQADMYGRSLKCELEACYLTNIAPQKPDFNRKIWLNIENLVQKWAKKYGILYIVTGPIFDNDKTYLKKENRIEIPDSFYKIVIKESRNKNNLLNYNILTFLLDQDDTSMNPESYLVSIDSIEILTGLDFFHLLEDYTENEIERVTEKRIW